MTSDLRACILLERASCNATKAYLPLIRGMDSAGSQLVPVRTHGIDGDIRILLQHWQGAVAHALLIGEGPAIVGIPHQLRTLQLLALLSIARPASDLVSALPVYVKHLQTRICLEWASTLSVMQARPPFTECHTR